jgi:RHS repeat-associated protein
VGGVLAVNIATNGTHFAAYDGNGNVSGLVSAGSGAITAQYEYSPFGETLRANGVVAKANPIRFSTQFVDEITRRPKYLHREYEPPTGRWLSRDPINEPGFQALNRTVASFARNEEKALYAFVGNNPIDNVDALGLCKPFVCGPDVGKWLEWEMKQNAASAAAAAIAANNAAPFLNLAAKKRAYKQWIGLVQAGAAWDFKTFLNPANANAPKSGNCPHEKCAGFLTLCGACYRYDIVANIHYGYVGKAVGFSNSELLGGAGVAQILDNWNGVLPDFLWDEPEDADAIRVGMDMFGGKTLCAALQGKKAHKPPADCSPCPHKWAK